MRPNVVFPLKIILQCLFAARAGLYILLVDSYLVSMRVLHSQRILDIIEGNAECRLHRSSPKENSLRWTAGVIMVSRTGILDVFL
jgi:hypothetical protein